MADPRFLGLQNREALLRLCPTVEIGVADPAPQLHFEFRGGDIGANPWLLLGSLLLAGLEGLRQGLGPAYVFEGEVDPDDPQAGPTELPRRLGEALDLFEQDAVVSSDAFGGRR